MIGEEKYLDMIKEGTLELSKLICKEAYGVENEDAKVHTYILS